ncbi:MAG: FAD-linked oxidase [Phycisphaerae bacterium]|nr:FAD-linked oxidase [Phycisphaerae bacterium]
MARIPLTQVASPGLSGNVLAALREIDDLEVRGSRHDRLLYSTDASMYQVEPLGVVIPSTVAAVAAAVQVCAEHGVPMLPRGGGTSLAGQTTNRALVIDCSADLRAIRAIDVSAGRVDVEPGVVLDDLLRTTAAHGLTFGPDVSTSTHATLGGMIANCSAGLRSLVYGMTDEHLHAVDLLLANGRSVHLSTGASDGDELVGDLTRRVVEVVLDLEEAIEAKFPKVRRNVGGYKLDVMLEQVRTSTPGTFDAVNLARLVAGSEGTLGLVTGATLGLVAPPESRGLAVLGFKNVEDALSSLKDILGTSPSAVELLDGTILESAKGHEAYRELLDVLPRVDGGLPGAVLYVEYFGDDEEEVTGRFATLRVAVPEAVIDQHVDPGMQARLWKLRKVSLSLMSGTIEDRKPVPMLEDCAVPAEHLAAFQRDFSSMLQRHGRAATWYAHASVGLLHIRPRLDLETEEDRAILQALGTEAIELVRRYGGSISGEHGDGRSRGWLVREFYGPELMEGFRRIKDIFDPEGLFNPGMFEADPMKDWRQAPGGRAFPEGLDTETYYDWSEHRGLLRAAAACNGNGLCRATTGGAMCPSYRATRDERHATRGRGNALRLAMTGQFGEEGTPDWNDAETMETLDLCLGCKACRYECPSHVDMTKLKAEYEAQRWKALGRVSFRRKLIANVRRINRIGSTIAPLANGLCSFPPVSGLIKRIMGMAPERSLPRFDRSLQSSMRRHAGIDGPAVLLLPDCFTSYNDPLIGRAAVRLLEAFGYRVILPEGMGCCGRTQCSAGMLDEARKTIEHSAQHLLSAIEAHAPVAIVGAEPSCITSLQQEWVELVTRFDRADTDAIASMSFTIEEFIEASWEKHPRRPDFNEVDEEIVLHVHCHQKHRAESSERFLHKCGWPGARLLDSGCCGMAGSFGYAAEHHALSVRIAEESLGDPLGGDCSVKVSANGTSCRHQVQDVFDREAEHPVVLAVQRLAAPGEMGP